MNILEYLAARGYTIPNGADRPQIPCILPGHVETVASFTIYPESNSFCCYGCGKAGSLKYLMRLLGDAVPFDMETEEIDLVGLLSAPKKPIVARKASAIARIARLRRRGYPSPIRLNNRAAWIAGYRKEDGTGEDTTFWRPTYKTKARQKVQ